MASSSLWACVSTLYFKAIAGRMCKIDYLGGDRGENAMDTKGNVTVIMQERNLGCKRFCIGSIVSSIGEHS